MLLDTVKNYQRNDTCSSQGSHLPDRRLTNNRDSKERQDTAHSNVTLPDLTAKVKNKKKRRDSEVAQRGEAPRRSVGSYREIANFFRWESSSREGKTKARGPRACKNIHGPSEEAGAALWFLNSPSESES